MPRARPISPWLHHTRRTWLGTRSAVAGLALPLGPLWAVRQPTVNEQRLADGLVLVLPGIEGSGPVNRSIAAGLGDAGVPAAIRVHDWTTGLWPLLLFHLRARRRNRRQAQALAGFIVRYQDAFPGRPVSLVGHSGGGALAVWTLEALPPDRTVSTAVLLGPALSPAYALGPALRKVQRGIWHFYSPLDLFLLGLGTLLFGTVDGRHAFSAGLFGFQPPRGTPAEADLYRQRLHQRCYRPAMARRFHLGGHFGWANRVFVAETLGPLLTG